MKLTLSLDPSGKSLRGLAVAVLWRCVGLALASKVINLGCSCSLSFVSQIAQAVKNGCVRASASPALREGVRRDRISLRKELRRSDRMGPSNTLGQGPSCLGQTLWWDAGCYSPTLHALNEHLASVS